MLVLGIESSCDETACAVVEDGRKVLSNVVATQIAEHRLYGGVVPEIASRRHSENILGVAKAALADAGCEIGDIGAIAVTFAPGLIGALLVGVSFAKGLAIFCGKPLVPVHHIAGHIASLYLSGPLEPPFLCLVASGGHSLIVEVLNYTEFRVVGRTHDDAAGECFDKAARVLGYPYPGGKFIDEAAKSGDPTAFSLPRPKIPGCPFDFSFSGLKTAVVNLAHNAEQRGESLDKADVAASFQRAVSSVLAEKLMLAAKELGYQKIAVAGGVSANSGVRTAVAEACKMSGRQLFLPDLKFCGDNGAMIASQGYYDFIAGRRAGADLNGRATMSLEELNI